MATPKIVELPSGDESPSTLTKALEARTTSKTTTTRTTIETAPRVGSKKSKRKAAASLPTTWSWFLFKWSLFTLLLAFGAAQFIAGDLLWGYRGKYTKLQTYTPPPKKVFTPEELSQYNGSDPDKPVYLAIMGKVYDVTPGRWVYGPRGAYHFFAGRDASRAYVTGCFETHLTHDLRGLTLEEIQQIAVWKGFFDDHGKYRQIGSVDLPTIDPKSPIPAPCREKKESPEPSAVASSQ